MCSIYWILQELLWQRVSYKQCIRVRESSSGFRDACETAKVWTQTQRSSPEYRTEQKHSCCARAFLQPHCTLRQKSFTNKSGVLHFCDLQRTKASALSSFYLTFSHGINKSMLITRKKKKVFKGNAFLLWISKTLICLKSTM